MTNHSPETLALIEECGKSWVAGYNGCTVWEHLLSRPDLCERLTRAAFSEAVPAYGTDSRTPTGPRCKWCGDQLMNSTHGLLSISDGWSSPGYYCRASGEKHAIPSGSRCRSSESGHAIESTP